MAKKAKKMESWRTLARQATKEKRPAEAAWLRRKSAALRRADRAAKGTKKTAPAGRGAKAWATRRANALKKAAAEVSAQVGKRESWQVVDRGLPGQGELVGGAYSQLADSIAQLARKKGGTDAIQNELAALAQASKYAGSVETDKAATKRLIEVQQTLADRVVCGFISEVDYTMKFHRGLPPDQPWLVSSFLITKIVDALNNAGYRASGKT